MARLCLINFPGFSESKEILKIGRSEVYVLGAGGGGVLNSPSLYLYIHILNWCLPSGKNLLFLFNKIVQ